MIVLDCSSVLTLCFEDEDAERLLDHFVDEGAVAPEIWPLEVCNVLLVAVRRRRLAKAEANHVFHLVSALPVEINVAFKSLGNYSSLFEIADKHGLSAYDVSYLALAMERNMPLATTDSRLIQAAEATGVELF